MVKFHRQTSFVITYLMRVSAFIKLVMICIVQEEKKLYRFVRDYCNKIENERLNQH